MKYTLKKTFENILLYCSNNIVTNMNDEFSKLTGYTKEKIIGKSLTEVSCMLRINSQIYLENIEDKYDCYIFTKEYEPREVTIACKLYQSENKKIYLFKEKVNSRIEDKNMYIEQLYKDNQMEVAVYSFPDFILLRANDKHLENYYPYNNEKTAIGKSLKELVAEKQWIGCERCFFDVINGGKSYYGKELEYKYAFRETKYYDISLVPIHINGKVKYVVQTLKDVTERVLIRKLAEEKTKQLEVILQNMSDGVLVVDKDLNIIAKNRSLRGFLNDCEDFNKADDSLKATKYYDLEGNLITLDDIPIRRVFSGEKVKDFRITAYRTDGVYYLSCNGSPIHDKNGVISKVIISLRDITEQVKKDKLIKKQNEMLNAIIENISDELAIMDGNGKYKMANKAFRNRLSINTSELITKDNIIKNAKYYDIDGKFISFENLPTQRLARGEKFSQYRIDYKYGNGCVVHGEVSGTPIYDSEGNFIAGVLIGRDIDERLKNEENKLMKAQYEILSRTIENLNLNYTLISYPDSKIKYINRNAFNYLRKINPQIESIDSYIGKNLYEMYKNNMNEKTEIDMKIKELIANKERFFIFNNKSLIAAKELFQKFIFQPLYNLNNQVTEVVAIGMDMTEEIEAKNKMEEALKLQDEIFTNVTHELKTPLNVIYCSIQLVEMYLKSGSIEANREKLFNNINIIKQNCYRFMKLINNIVDTSKLKCGYLKLDLSNENIVEVVEDIVQSVSEYIKGKGINIIFDTNIEEKIIACDTNKIERIMLNLISNAVKFSNSGNSIYVNVLDKNNTIEISVRDTGIGIDKKYLDRIFNRFNQVDKSLSRNAEGSGIGLALVKSLVEMHGGEISLDSEVGKGSVFTIEIPSRIIEEDEIVTDNIKPISNKIQMINIEFSDIYSI